MLLEKLKKLKQGFERFNTLSVDAFISYLSEVEHSRTRTVVPEILAKRLNVSQADALFLLGVAEQRHVLKRGYQVFTVDDVSPLGEFPSKSQIPDKIYKPGTNEIVDRDHYFVDLVFHLPKD